MFSFKLRGAYNKLRHLPAAALEQGVIAASAGNHAQGVSMGASRLGVQAVIVMPKTTPAIKVDAVRPLGRQGGPPRRRSTRPIRHAMELAEERGLTFLHPFDDPDVIAGQGTIGMEILRQLPEPPYAIFVPVGGGGLIAGIAAYVKSIYPEVRLSASSRRRRRPCMRPLPPVSAWCCQRSGYSRTALRSGRSARRPFDLPADGRRGGIGRNRCDLCRDQGYL